MFIVFEGVDGTGKSTQLEKCRDWMEQLGHQVEVCRDPGSTSLGIKLREILLQRSELQIDFVAESFLFMAARAQMVAELIKPALQQGKVVLCDRFVLSTVVYQGHAGNIRAADLWNVNAVATEGVTPDLVLVFDAPLEIAMQRVGPRRDRMESRGSEYFEQVRQGFLTEASQHDTIQVIDASGNPDEIHQQVQTIVRTCLPTEVDR